MNDPKVVSREDYDDLRRRMEERYDYAAMTDEEKAAFDERLHRIAVAEPSPGDAKGA